MVKYLIKHHFEMVLKQADMGLRPELVSGIYVIYKKGKDALFVPKARLVSPTYNRTWLVVPYQGEDVYLDVHTDLKGAQGFDHDIGPGAFWTEADETDE